MPRLFETTGATGCSTDVDDASAAAGSVPVGGALVPPAVPPASAAAADGAQVTDVIIATRQLASGTAGDKGCLRDSLDISVILGMGVLPSNTSPPAPSEPASIISVQIVLQRV